MEKTDTNATRVKKISKLEQQDRISFGCNGCRHTRARFRSLSIFRSCAGEAGSLPRHA